MIVYVHPKKFQDKSLNRKLQHHLLSFFSLNMASFIVVGLSNNIYTMSLQSCKHVCRTDFMSCSMLMSWHNIALSPFLQFCPLH